MSTDSEALAIARINIAQIEVTVSHLNSKLSALEMSNQQLTAKLDQVLLTLSEARGGWRTLMLVGGASASASGLLAWAVQHFKG